MRYTPFESFDRFFEQMRRDMMDWRESAEEWPAGSYSGGMNMDLAEHDGEFVFTADLPGFEKDEIDLRLDGEYLVVSASHEATGESARSSRSIHERVSLPAEIIEEEVSATYRNGVLEVHLPVVEGSEETGHHIDIE